MGDVPSVSGSSTLDHIGPYDGVLMGLGLGC